MIHIKKKVYTKIVLIFTIGLVCFNHSCTKNFEAYNTDPTRANSEHLTYDNIGLGGFITQMQTKIFPSLTIAENADVNNYQLIYSLMGDIYSGHQGTSNAYGNNGVNNSTYAMIPQWYGAAFSNAYQNVMAPWYAIKQKSELSAPSTFAVAQILKVMGMHRIVDTYGPLPYLEFQTGKVNTPYNSEREIYFSFFEDLDSAILILEDFVVKNPSAKPLAKFDLIYNGDFSKWLKFANSLKLRLAMRIVNVEPQKSKEAAEQAIVSGVMTVNADNALLKVDGVSSVNPLHMISESYDDTRMGATMESFLKGYKDPRIKLLFMPVSVPSSSPADYRGVRTGIRFSGQAYAVFSKLNVTPATPIQWMTASEIYFLRAEGALRGWNMSGTAKELYETGIRTAFSQPIGGSQLSAGDASTYINDAASLPAAYTDPLSSGNNIASTDSRLSRITIRWQDGANFNTNLERIITQKWIALYPDGQEAWSEFRRTGFPKIFPVRENLSGGLINTQLQIRRSPFPQNEYLNNNTSLLQGIALLTNAGPDNGGTPLWWDTRR